MRYTYVPRRYTCVPRRHMYVPRRYTYVLRRYTYVPRRYTYVPRRYTTYPDVTRTYPDVTRTYPDVTLRTPTPYGRRSLDLYIKSVTYLDVPTLWLLRPRPFHFVLDYCTLLNSSRTSRAPPATNQLAFRRVQRSTFH